MNTFNKLHNERRLNQILTTYFVVVGGLRPTSIDIQCQLMVLMQIWRGHVTYVNYVKPNGRVMGLLLALFAFVKDKCNCHMQYCGFWCSLDNFLLKNVIVFI